MDISRSTPTIGVKKLHRLYQPVSELMQRVGDQVILPHFQNLQSHEIIEKSPGELVTVADRLSEEMLTEGLASLLPEAAIVGEEAVAADPTIIQHLNDDLVWIVDPIDGTSNFSEGKSPFGIIIENPASSLS